MLYVILWVYLCDTCRKANAWNMSTEEKTSQYPNIIPDTFKFTVGTLFKKGQFFS